MESLGDKGQDNLVQLYHSVAECVANGRTKEETIRMLSQRFPRDLIEQVLSEYSRLAIQKPHCPDNEPASEHTPQHSSHPKASRPCCGNCGAPILAATSKKTRGLCIHCYNQRSPQHQAQREASPEALNATSCQKCGARTLAVTAQKSGGLCVKCCTEKSMPQKQCETLLQAETRELERAYAARLGIAAEDVRGAGELEQSPEQWHEMLRVAVLEQGDSKLDASEQIVSAGMRGEVKEAYTIFDKTPEHQFDALRTLVGRMGLPVRCVIDSVTPGLTTTLPSLHLIFGNGEVWAFCGFTAGYVGTGPSLTYDLLTQAGFNVTRDEIYKAQLPLTVSRTI